MRDTIVRLGKFTLFRVLSLIITVIIAVYLAVFIANWGGHLDATRKANIRYETAIRIYANPSFQTLSTAELQKLVDEQAQLEFKRKGLDRPFILRSFSYLYDAISLNLGRSEYITSDSGSRVVQRILVEASRLKRNLRMSARICGTTLLTCLIPAL